VSSRTQLREAEARTNSDASHLPLPFFLSRTHPHPWSNLPRRLNRRLLPSSLDLHSSRYLWDVLRQGIDEEEARSVPHHLPGKLLSLSSISFRPLELISFLSLPALRDVQERRSHGRRFHDLGHLRRSSLPSSAFFTSFPQFGDATLTLLHFPLSLRLFDPISYPSRPSRMLEPPSTSCSLLRRSRLVSRQSLFAASTQTSRLTYVPFFSATGDNESDASGSENGDERRDDDLEGEGDANGLVDEVSLLSSPPHSSKS